jgi:hypothetical protein
MRLPARGLFVVSMLSGAVLAGCGSTGNGPTPGILDRLSTLSDTDGNGFVEVPATAGVDTSREVAVAIENDITRTEAISLAQTSVPNFVADSISLSATVLVKMTYADGKEQQLRGSRNIGPFDLSFEVACPDRVEVNVNVTADIPVVGRTSVQTFGPFVFSKGTNTGQFQCDTVIHVRSFVDASGQPKATAMVEAMPGSDGSTGTVTGGDGTGTGSVDGSGSTTVGTAGTDRR